VIVQPELGGSLVGRERELARLVACVGDLAAGRGGSVWIEGEPGIGKSALLEAGLAGAPAQGCTVFSAVADELSGRFPLRVLLDCLRVGTAPDAERAEIAGLLQGAGSSGAVTPGDIVGAAAERLVVLVERLCAGAPVALVVDDLQWADEASLAVWQRLHRLVPQLPLLLVAACRPVPRRAELAALRRSMSGTDAVVIDLPPLGPEQVAELVRRLLAAAPGPRLRAHARQAGGNPLYIRELVDGLVRDQLVKVENGTVDLIEEVEVLPPVSVAAAISRRLGFLSNEAITVLRGAAVLGSTFSVAGLGVLTGRTPTYLAEVVHEAVTAGVLVESGDRLAFRHALIRHALYEQMPVSLRSALHRQAAEALASAGAPVVEVAEQLLAAPDAVDGWVTDWVASATDVLVHRAPEVAVDLLRRVRAQGRPPDPLIDAGLATASFLLGRYDEVESLARPVLAGTRDATVAGRLAWALGYALLRLGRNAQALTVISQVMTGGLVDPVWTARMWALRALVEDNVRDFEAESTASRAVAEGERVHDRLAIGYALHVRHLIQGTRGDQQASLETIDRALAVIGEEPETTDLRLLLLGNRSVPLDELARVSEADRSIGEALTLAERSGSPQRLANLRIQAADNYFRRGRWDDALAELEVAVAAGTSVDPNRRLWMHGLAALISCHRDDRAAVTAHVAAVADIDVTAGYQRYYAECLRMAQARTAERDGEPAQALAVLRATFDTGWADDIVARWRSHLWLPDVVRVALGAGDLPLARAAAEFCAAEADRSPLPNRQAADQECRGLMTADPAPVLAAADIFDRIDAPLHRAHALENAGVLLARRGDPAAARAASTGAIEIYTGLGAGWDIRRLNTRLREFGIRHGFRGRRSQRPATGWAALTPTELKIAELIATGRSNPDIATALWLSRRTVQSHVSNILTKLDARSRVEIARAAYAHTRAG
jgi:DNA-binding CsgD family transcriptional regulator/tetratricopeptide (TPR) repeat protein